MNEEREKLIKEIFYSCDIDSGTQRQALESIADYILEDRKRICAPLVDLRSNNNPRISSLGELARLQAEAISKTLKLAGFEDGR